VPGWDARWHTHPADVWIVGIRGAYLGKDDAGEKRVGPGDFLRVPAAINTGAAAIRRKAARGPLAINSKRQQFGLVLASAGDAAVACHGEPDCIFTQKRRRRYAIEPLFSKRDQVPGSQNR